MIEDNDNQITLVPTKTGDLIDPNTTKYERLEDRLDEVEANLIELASQSSDAATEMFALAVASQDPAYYEALAKVILATSKANRDVVAVVQAKRDLIKAQGAGNSNAAEPDDDSKVTNNVLVLTTSELLEQILNKNR